MDDDRPAIDAIERKKLFEPLKTVLRDIGSSVDTRYIEVTLFENAGRIELGILEGPDRAVDKRWDIKPDIIMGHDEQSGDSYVEKGSGYILKERDYSASTSGPECEKRVVKLPDERAVGTYLMQDIGQRLSVYENDESSIPRSTDKPGE